MLYYLYELFQDSSISGIRLMGYITFRSVAALVIAMLIATLFGRKIIERLQIMQVGEIVRNLGLEGQEKKKGVPTMGGLIIILAILVPCILIGNLSNVYMVLMIIATIWLGILGFLDDYLKFKRRNKDGMKGGFKIIGQVGLGLIVGLTMWFSPQIVMRPNAEVTTPEATETVITYSDQNEKSPQTTIPFVKNNNFDYRSLTAWTGDTSGMAGWIAFVIVTIFVVAATSNGANLTDGLDGLCTGSSAIMGGALAIMAYLGGHIGYSAYLNIMYIPDSAELVVFMAAFIGALIGFLWYNAYPAQVFMGDTGSLTLGGIIAVFAILIRKELLIPILCAVFFIEDLSVIIQTVYFRLTHGKRVFKMTPLHHHFQRPGDGSINALIQAPKGEIKESKIVTRFWIVGILFAIMTFATLKIR